MDTSGLSLLTCVAAGHPTISGHDVFGVLMLIDLSLFQNQPIDLHGHIISTSVKDRT
jgi:hypothetical protein